MIHGCEVLLVCEFCSMGCDVHTLMCLKSVMPIFGSCEASRVISFLPSMRLLVMQDCNVKKKSHC